MQSADMEARFRRSVSRVGVSVEKNANWFLEFSKLDPMRLDPSKVDDSWDDLITLSSDEGKMATSARVASEEIVTVLLSAGTKLLQDDKGASYREGAAVDVPESVGETLVRKCMAEYLSQPLLPTDERSYEAVLDRWSRAAYWRLWRPNENQTVFWKINECIRKIHTQIRAALEDYLRGRRPLIDIKDVCLRVGATQLSPVTPKHFWCMPNGLRFVEGPVLLRFVQVFEVYKRLLRRCPECKLLYIAGRQDQRFCTGKCRARRGMRGRQRGGPKVAKEHRPPRRHSKPSAQKNNHRKEGRYGKRRRGKRKGA